MASWSRYLTAAGAAIVLLATSAIYTARLDVAPPYAAADETHFAAHAWHLATEGRDLGGQRLPVFFHIFDPLADVDRMRVWYQPFLFYLLAASLKLQSLDEAAIRTPVALLGVLNVGLMFVVARRFFHSAALGVAAAALLALTPAHFLFSRMAMDYICPLPFILGWLWLTMRYLEHERGRDLAAAALVLGIGVYTYIASWMLLPLLALVTVVVVKPSRRTIALGVATFAAPTLVLLSLQPRLGAVVTDTIARYQLASNAATVVPLSERLKLHDHVALYWDYFNPSFLFFAGGNDLLLSTSRAGVFLLPASVLMVIGTIAMVRRRSREDVLVVAGLLAAPLPIAILIPEAPQSSTGRILPMLIFGVLIAIVGAEELWRRGGTARAALAALALLMPAQFIMFRSDYFGDYQARAWMRFDPNATRDVVNAVIALDSQAAIPAILLNDDGDDKGIRWRFSTLKLQREDLWRRTHYFHVDSDAIDTSPGTVILMRAGDARSAKVAAAGYSKIATVNSVSGEAATDLFRRAP